MHFYHPFCERLWAHYHVRSTIVKVALDQAFAAPPFLATFLAYTAFAEGLGPGGAADRVAEQLPLLWGDSLCFWPLAHCVTFSAAPASSGAGSRRRRRRGVAGAVKRTGPRADIPVPVRVLWQDLCRIYFGTLMSLRGTARVGGREPGREGT